MFVHHCTACDRRQLTFPSQASRMITADGGSVFAFTCWCGAEQTTEPRRFVAA